MHLNWIHVIMSQTRQVQKGEDFLYQRPMRCIAKRQLKVQSDASIVEQRALKYIQFGLSSFHLHLSLLSRFRHLSAGTWTVFGTAVSVTTPVSPAAPAGLDAFWINKYPEVSPPEP
jgi:hypothetical protein